jgi:phage FluMu gp28-like protein
MAGVIKIKKTSKPVAVAKTPSPRDIMLPYQKRWADDESRFKIGCMSRQVGKDFSSAEEGVRDCYLKEMKKEKTTWLIAAPSERQSLESLEKWKEWVEAYKLSIADYAETRDGIEAVLKSAQITFPGGSRVIAVPGKPDTVRGYSANILMTEFAFFEDPDRTWRAILPSVTNPLRGGAKKVRLISTPNGIGNKFHDLWEKNYDPKSKDKSAPGKQKWSCHRITIHDAVADGLPVDVDELRESLSDPDGWAQEFECEFMDTSAVLLPYEIIAPCENPLATEIISPEFWAVSNPKEPLYLGIDFGRSRNLTVCWTLAEIGGAYRMTREVLTLAKMPTPEQVELLRLRIRPARRVCLDYTGPGVGMGDYLVKEFGEYNPERHQLGKIELCTFTNDLKNDIFPKLRMAFEARNLGIPVSRVIREDLHSVYRITTPSGNITYKAPNTDDSHADRCTGLALAYRAAGRMGSNVLVSTKGIRIGNSQFRRLKR